MAGHRGCVSIESSARFMPVIRAAFDLVAELARGQAVQPVRRLDLFASPPYRRRVCGTRGVVWLDRRQVAPPVVTLLPIPRNRPLPAAVVRVVTEI